MMEESSPSFPQSEPTQILERTKDSTNLAWGSDPLKRPIAKHLRLGVIAIDKPSGPSSHEVVAWIKRMLSLEHAGHAGTLDPAVTGVLPVALQDATKALAGMIHSSKEYVCIMRIHAEIPRERVESVVHEFIGPIYQRPPLRSAVKREVRIRRIFSIDILEITSRDVLFRVNCQAGTYIRKLCYEIGNVLGSGAHMKELRRTRSGPFSESEGLTTLQDLQDAYTAWHEEGDERELRRHVKPVETAAWHLGKIYIRDSAVDAICHGASLAVPGIVKLESGIKKDSMVAVMTLKGEFVALGRSVMNSEEILKADHGLAATTERVIMNPEVYPRMWG
jgi:tRNA pseudouridine55 synthase